MASLESPPLSLGNRLWLNGAERTVAELLELAHARFGGGFEEGAGVAFSATRQEAAVLGAIWLASVGKPGVIVARQRLTSSMNGRLVSEGFQIVSAESGEVLGRAAATHPSAGIRILTSGTTGAPKLISHSWRSLFTAAAVREPRPLRWLMTFQPGTYAWYQIVTPLLFQPGSDLAVSLEPTVSAMIEEAARSRVTAVSSTPTFWRLALLQCGETALREIHLKQISLGGEPVDQELLDILGRLFPDAALTHIFASTESGPAFVVNDRRAGFPSSWIDDQGEGRGICVRDGRLHVRTRWAAVGAPEWVATGDRVEVRGDRAFVIGRDGQTDINVGGLKVSTFDVETVVSRCPGVLWCRVFAIKAPLVGQLVAAEVVGKPGTGAAIDLERDVSLFCANRLAEHMVPRVIRVLDTVPATQTLKAEVLRG